MTEQDLILLLSVACGALAFLSITWFFTVEQHYAHAVEARLLAHQQAAIAHAQTRRAEQYKVAQEQATNCANLLAAHVTELEADNADLQRRVLYLTNLIRKVDSETIFQMEIMHHPQVILVNDTINLN